MRRLELIMEVRVAGGGEVRSADWDEEVVD